MESHPLIKYLIFALLIMIIGTLGAAFYKLFFRGHDDGTAGVKALTVRVGLSIALFIFLMVLYSLGIIHPHGG